MISKQTIWKMHNAVENPITGITTNRRKKKKSDIFKAALYMIDLYILHTT